MRLCIIRQKEIFFFTLWLLCLYLISVKIFSRHHTVTISWAIVQAEITAFPSLLDIQQPISTRVPKIYAIAQGRDMPKTPVCV